MVDISDRIKRRLISGLLFYGAAKLVDTANKYAAKYFKEHTKGAVGVGLGLALESFAPESIRYEEVFEPFVDAMADYGVMSEMRVLIDKEPVCWAQDANTIICKNFQDLANAIVFIDGVQKAPNTDYKVSGTDTISLTSPLPSGDHDIIVIDGTKTKAFAGKIRV
jgi:hypothetical protein